MNDTPKVILERMASSNRNTMATAAMLCLNSLQNFPADTQTAAVALLFIRLCKRHGLRPVEVMQISENIFTDGERVHPTFRAVDAYISGENL